MLKELHIRNFALIDEIYLSFDGNLNILSGETGAGKTIIVEALQLLLGEYADASLIRTGQKEALVEVSFSFENNEDLKSKISEESFLKEGEDLIVSRLVTIDNKNKCYINGRIINLSKMSEICRMLVDLHGQHEQQTLLKSKCHLEYLDRFGGENLLTLKQRYGNIYNELVKIEDEIKHLAADEMEKAQQIDLLKFQIDEIGKVNLKAEEEEKLSSEKLLLQNAEKLYHHLRSAYEILSGAEIEKGGTREDLRLVLKEISTAAEIDMKLKDIASLLEESYYRIDDICESMRKYLESIIFDPDRLDEIEKRLSEISLLKRKYGKSISEILEFRKNALKRLESMTHSEERLQKLNKVFSKRKEDLIKCGGELSKKRREVAGKFGKNLEKELVALNLDKVKFRVNFEKLSPLNIKDVPSGFDAIEFYISPNPGEPLKPLAKIASYGEISRIMLALKIILSRADEINTLIFDEIDVGIGGPTAGIVGEKMSLLSKIHQIICITHLPQIAAYADRQFSVYKMVEGERTSTYINELNSETRIDELARMFGDTKKDIARIHGEELLKKALEFKK